MNEPRQPSPVSPGQPIRVHLLTEFVYCPRAGLAQFEDGRIDVRERKTPRQDYLPEFELMDILSLRRSLIRQIWVGVLLLFGYLLLATLLGWLVHEVFFLSGFLGGLILGIVVVRLAHRAAVLTLRLSAYYRARPGAPSADLPQDQVVNWWSMLKDGFDCSPGRDMVDNELGLRASPYYILRRGNLRIPVFHYNGEAETVRRQDRVRIAAYCHLLAVAEQADAPYGIILRAGTYDAVAIPNSQAARQMLRQELTRARETIRRSVEEHSDPRRPETARPCRRCRVGHPRPYDPRNPPFMRYGEPLSPQLCDGGSGRSYHSLCGDRFEWTPPHEIASRRGWTE